MDARLVEFSNVLRRNGLRVSAAENMDALRGLTLLGIGERRTVKDALRATLVKRATDVPLFDELFDLYFSGVSEIIHAAEQRTIEALELDSAAFQALVEALLDLTSQLGMELSPLARALLAADTAALERLLRAGADRSRIGEIQQPFQEAQFTHTLARAIGLSDLAQELARLHGGIGAAGLDPELAALLGRYLERRLQELREVLRGMVRAELGRHDLARHQHVDLQRLAEKSFYYLTEDEIRRMKEAVSKLAQRLKNVVTIKRRHAKRGRFDLQRTLRHNLQYGGVPFTIRFDVRQRERPQVMVLCDVSDSVRNVSRFMLQFVYSLQDLYSRVRSFVFVSELGEITQLFEENDINEAIEIALRGGVINVFAHSDFGRAFRAFHRDYLPAVNRRTSVIILGDARNNYNAPHDRVLREVQQRAKQVIWLNPESRVTWGFGDSEMNRYAPHCDLVEECRNLTQLYRVIDRLTTS